MRNKNILSVGLIWSNPFSSNLVVGALAYSAIAILNDAAEEIGLSLKLTVIGSSTNDRRSLEVNNKTYQFENIDSMDYLEWKTIPKIFFRYSRYRVHELLKFDIIFDVGEGDSFSDIYGIKRFNRINNSKLLFELLKIKQVLLPQTIGPFSEESNLNKAISSTKNFKYLLARDKSSYDYAVANFKNQYIKELIDLAFYLPFEKKIFDSSFIHVGLNVSGLLWMGGYTKSNQFKLTADYREIIKKTIEFFINVHGVKLHLVPHVVDFDQNVEADNFACVELNRMYDQTILAPTFNNPVEAKSYISGLDFFSGARMHSCIAAFSANVPVYPMAYSRKFSGLFSETLGYNMIGNMVESPTKKVLDDLFSSYQNRKILSEQMYQINNSTVRKRINELKEILKNIYQNA